MIQSNELKARKTEFEAHLWNHSEDLFQMHFDSQSKLNEESLAVLRLITEEIRSGSDIESIKSAIYRLLVQNPDRVYILMQIVGLTRNKIITDLKAALPTVSVPGKAELLHRSPDVWKHAGSYLATRLKTVLTPISGFDKSELNDAFQSLNQATWPGWIRQERAKRQGHEAEHRIAIVLDSLKIPFEPAEKLTNPLCRDATVHDISYDLVVPGVKNPKVCIKATVHTSNIGQYGESKDALEIDQARDSLKANFKTPPTLVAMIDGVGFRSNTAGLNGVLTGADEFCQFRTIWKVAVIGAAAIGKKLEVAIPDANEHRAFLDRFSASIKICAKKTESAEWCEAGEAWLRII